MEYFRSLSDYAKEHFGKKLYKLALQGGMTCPNRDGTLGYGGCIFCSERGSGDFAAPKAQKVSLQIDRAIELLGKKASGVGFIAYFQDHTNTYASPEYLRSLFLEAVRDERIDVLSVATRPDCLPDAVLRVLEEVGKIKPLWVELGLQTIHESTAKYIRRGYPLPVFDKAVEDLKAIGSQVIVHQIIGLPGETPAMIEETARYIGRSGADGIKLQLLHVLSDSDLANEYRAGRVKPLSLNEYCELLARCIRALPPEMTVHRITGDGDKRTLVAPLWSADKKRTLQYIYDYFEENRVRQGQSFFGDN